MAQAISSTTPTMHMRTTSGVENCVRMSERPRPAVSTSRCLVDEPLPERASDAFVMRLDFLLVDLLVDDVELHFGLLGRHAGLQAAPMTVTQRLRRLSRSFQVGVICAFIIIGTMTSRRADLDAVEPGGRHADDRHRVAVDDERLIEDRRVAAEIAAARSRS